MRTTLTLDDDVAVRLKALQESRRISLKEAVNSVLREGLGRIDAPQKKRVPYRMRPVSVGRLLIPNLDCISAVLELVEGPEYK